MNLHRTIFVASAVVAFVALLPTPRTAAQPGDNVTTLLAQSRAALGGSALDRIKTLRLDAKLSVGGLSGTGTSWIEMGGKRFSEFYNTPPLIGGDGFDGTDAWSRDWSGLVWVDGGEAGRTQEISQAFVANYALWSPNRGGATVAWGGEKTMGGRTYDTLVVTAPGAALPFQMWFDRTTHLPARVTQAIGPDSSTTTYADYSPVNGLLVARTIHNESSEGNKIVASVTRAVVDPSDGTSQLAKPPSTVHDFSMLNGATQTSIPFDLVENHVYLDLKLNGKGPFRFIYDTGGSNIVDPGVAQAIGATGHGSMQGGGVGSTTESLSFATVDEMQIGDAVLKDQLFAVAPTRQGFGMSGGQPVDGLIGFEVLSRFITTFDYGSNHVILQLPNSTQTASNGSAPLPFVLDGQQPQFACSINGISSQCTLDTGSRTSIDLMSPFLAAHPQVVPKQLSAVGVNGFGFGGPAFGKLGRLQSLQIGNYTLQDVIGDFTTQDKGALAAPFVAANVGGGVWKRFVLKLDYYKQTMALTPTPAYSEPDVYERAGLFLLNRGGKYVVLDVRPDTASAQAGIVKGDTIASIDGKPASSMTLQAVRQFFFGPAGTSLQIGLIEPSGAQRSVTLVLRDII